MKNIVIKYKEMIISIIIISFFIGISGINYYNKTKIISDNSNKPISNEDSNPINIEPNSYYLGNDNLYVSYDGENIIKVPGDFSRIIEYKKGTYQISEEKTVFYYNVGKNEYIVYSDDCGKSWNITTNKADGNIEYIEFIDKNIGYMYKIKDVAVTIAYGSISKTTDGGKTWKEVSSGINERFKRNSQVKFFDYYLGFITMPYNGDNGCELYVTTNGGETFNKVEVNHTELEDKQFTWDEIYDSYNMPTKENGIYYLEVGQGADGDYNGGNSVVYYSYNGISWTTEELEKQYEQNWKEQINERIKNRDKGIFLKDFERYNPSSSEIKLSQAEAEKIAEIGFKEINETIGEAGDKERQTVTIENAIANNLFTDNPASYRKIYKNINRMCYVFVRENDMGCGSKVYVDVTTGLIIGGDCFGD